SKGQLHCHRKSKVLRHRGGRNAKYLQFRSGPPFGKAPPFAKNAKDGPPKFESASEGGPPAFRAELLRQPVEHEDDASFLAGLKARMDSIEKLRNGAAITAAH